MLPLNRVHEHERGGEVADVMHAHQHERGGEVSDVMHALTESRRVPNTPHRWPPFSISRHNG